MGSNVVLICGKSSSVTTEMAIVDLLEQRNNAFLTEIERLEYNLCLSNSDVSKNTLFQLSVPLINDGLYYRYIAQPNESYSPIDISDNAIKSDLLKQGKPITETTIIGEKLKKLVQRLHALDPENSLLKDNHPLNLELFRLQNGFRPTDMPKKGAISKYLKSAQFISLPNINSMASANETKDLKRLMVPSFDFTDMHSKTDDDVENLVRLNFCGAKTMNWYQQKGFCPIWMPACVSTKNSFDPTLIKQLYLFTNIKDAIRFSYISKEYIEDGQDVMVLSFFSEESLLLATKKLASQFHQSLIYAFFYPDSDDGSLASPHSTWLKTNHFFMQNNKSVALKVAKKLLNRHVLNEYNESSKAREHRLYDTMRHGLLIAVKLPDIFDRRQADLTNWHELCGQQIHSSIFSAEEKMLTYLCALTNKTIDKLSVLLRQSFKEKYGDIDIKEAFIFPEDDYSLAYPLSDEEENRLKQLAEERKNKNKAWIEKVSSGHDKKNS